ncbi:MAG: extracellular solute-binding protein [Chloroflexota bacterium]
MYRKAVRRRGARRAWIAAACLVVPFLTACSSVEPRAASRASPVVLRVWYGSDDPTEGSLARALAARFQGDRSGVQVRLTMYNLDDINEKLELAIGAGTPPDLVYTTPRGPGLPAYVAAGKLRDLTSVAKREGWAADLPSGMLASYNDLLTPTGQAHGHIYAAPSILAAVAILYNKAVFSRLHLSIPHSAAAFEAICAKVAAAGLTPIGLGNADGWVGDDWYLTLINAETGPAPLRPELRLDPRFSFGSGPFLNAGATLQRWSTNGYFTKQFGGLDAQDSMTAFFEGATAMQLISSTENGQITTLARQTHVPVGVFAFPSTDPGRAPVAPQSGYAGWAVPRAGRHPALAEAFITAMLSDHTARLLAAHGYLPARPLPAAESRSLGGFQREFLSALRGAVPGVYLDGAPVPNLNATMEANVQLLLQHFEAPTFLPRSLQLVYDSHGAKASSTRTDGEF